MFRDQAGADFSALKFNTIESSSARILEKTHDPKSVLFFARRGAAKDGHDFLKALEKHPSIAGFVVERRPENFQPDAPVFEVRDSTLAMALAVKKFYKDPTADAFTFAVTGTNGKTTTTYLVQSLLKVLKKRPARMGTIETQFEDYCAPAELTTPDFTEVQKNFSELKARGADAFVFEASSHALDQRRLLGLEVDAALFTNLTPEHLDYHQTIEKYFLAKRRLFSEILMGSAKKPKIAILPHDGSYGSRLIEELSDRSEIEVWSWSKANSTIQASTLKSKRHLSVDEFTTSLSGTRVRLSGAGLDRVEFVSRLVGEYNVENIAGMVTLGVSLKASSIQIQKALDDLANVPGRLEAVKVPGDIGVFVDYAHTPDALENVLMTLRPLTEGRLRVVFGCGGDRDRTKRPKMGAIAELYADELFVTSDNPRTEDPESILGEIVAGLQRLKPVTVEVDRRKAIAKSLKNLKPGDIVLIAGKGHENYQILGKEKIHFDDREVVLECYSH